MKKYIIAITLVLLLGLLFQSGLARTGVEIEVNPLYSLKGADRLPLEITISNFSGVPVAEVTAFYRYSGESRFSRLPLKEDGLRYYASLKVDAERGHLVEYYYQIRYLDAMEETYPASAPETRLLRTAVQPGRNYGNDLVIISPEPNEQIYTDEIVITASFTRFADLVDLEKTRVFLDSWDISRFVLKYEDFISFSPKKVPPGRHKIRMELYDANNILVASREWYFTALASQSFRGDQSAMNVSGRFFAETRTEDYVDGTSVTDYNRAGLQLKGSIQNFQFGGRLYFSNQEKSDRQPVNRYMGFARLNFWGDRYLYASVGDAFPKFNPLVLENLNLRGFQGSLHLHFLNLDVAKGQTLRGIEGDSLNGYIRPGTYQRDILAIRPSFGSGKNMQLGFTYLKGKDDTTSINYGLNPQENAALGADLLVALDEQRIMLEANAGVSAYNRNITGGSLSYEKLQEVWGDSANGDEVISENLYNRITDVITVNQYLIPRPGLAYQGKLRLRYFNNNLSVMYESVDEDYYSLGQPYLLRDNRGIHIVDNIRLFSNQVFLTVGWRKYRNNLQNSKAHTTDNNSIYLNLAYYPRGNFPEITFGFNNYKRDNGVSADSINSIFNRPEDNQTISYNFGSGYRFSMGEVSHHISANLMSYRRTDIFKYAESSSDFLSAVLRSQYQIPLQTTLEFILQQTETGKDSDRSSSLDLFTLGVGGSYVFTNLFTQDRLYFQLKYRYSSVTNKAEIPNAEGVTIDYKRNYVSLRINYSIPRLGSLSLLGDLLSYSGDRSYRDLIYSARYEYNF